MGRILLVLVVLAAVLVGGFVALPFLSLSRLGAAIESGDSVALDAVVDFEALQQNLVTQARRTIDERSEDKPLGALRSAVVGRIAEFKLEQASTPEGMIEMACRDKVSGDAAQGCQLDGKFLGASFESDSEFSARVLPASGKPYRLVLRRQGLHWSLVDIESMADTDDHAMWRGAAGRYS